MTRRPTKILTTTNNSSHNDFTAPRLVLPDTVLVLILGALEGDSWPSLRFRPSCGDLVEQAWLRELDRALLELERALTEVEQARQEVPASELVAVRLQRRGLLFSVV